MQKIIFWIAILYRKIGRKVTFGPRRGVLKKFVLFRYSLALKSICIIQVDLPANTDILTYAHDIILEFGDFI